jgi:MFS transporter, ACS family, hexuronate transporter
VIYVLSDGGSIFFGWLATRLIGRGWLVNRARETTMLICAPCVVPIGFASRTSSVVAAIALISLAMAVHQGRSCNLFTTVSDMPQACRRERPAAGNQAVKSVRPYCPKDDRISLT